MKVTKNGDECSELQNSSLEKSPKTTKKGEEKGESPKISLEKSPKKVKEKVNHQKSLKKIWAPIWQHVCFRPTP